MHTFEKYGFSSKLLQTLEDINFHKPTRIQDKVIPEILSSKNDIIATAQTGTGKTAAFGLPIIQLTDNRNKDIECVILCPTRELCLQISKDLNTYTKHMKYYRIVSIYGGAKVEGQIRKLNENPKIVVCTPGRLNDLINRKRINLNSVNYFVLDEADEMLSMGFKSEIDKILNIVPKDRRIYLFSATMSKRVTNITQTYMTKPLTIAVSAANKGADTVRHMFYTSTKKNRYNLIRNIIDLNKDIYTIVFCRTRRETKEISKRLAGDGYNAKVLNGDLSQSERDNVMSQFRSKRINILVATDVASRGIDVDNLSHIINYNLPDDPEVYVHRSGRTGRAGNLGLSIVFVSKGEYKKLEEIKKLSKISFEESQPPSNSDIIESKINLFKDRVINASVDIDSELFKDLYKPFNRFTKDELIRKIITLNFDAKKSSRASQLSTETVKDHGSKVKNLFSKFIINIGRSDSVTPETLIKIINKTIRSRDTEIGKIDINKNYSTFEIDSKMRNVVLSKMKEVRHHRKKILVSDYNPNINDSSKKKNKNSPKKNKKNSRKKNYKKR